MNHGLKKYYRFRPAGFYGGIATGDTVGCNLRCSFCWSGHSVRDPLRTGEFYSSEQVAQTLLEIARKKQYRQIRISGGEPTLGKRHLLEVLRFIPEHYLFILETNGLLLGADVMYCKDLSVFENLHVRVCLKGADAEEFSLLTRAKDGFQYQQKAIEFLSDHQMNFHIALVSMDYQKKKRFYEWLKEMNLGHIMIEEEEVTLYPQVRKQLQQRHLLEYFLKKRSDKLNKLYVCTSFFQG